MTLASMKAQDMDLRVFCSVCGHFAVVDANILIERLGGDRPIQDAKHLMSCSQCKARVVEGWELTVMPDWQIGKWKRGPFSPEVKLG